MNKLTLFILIAGLLVLWSCNKNDTSNQQLGQVTACFSVVKDTVYTGDTVLFIGCSNNASTLLYNFGDGTTSSLRSPIHVFTQSGTYSVSLRATNQSQSNTTSKTIVVKATISTNLPWRYFKPGSSVDSMVFYGTGPGTFTVNGYELAGGSLPTNGLFIQGDSFTFGSPYTYFPYNSFPQIYGYGKFSNHDSTVNLSYSYTLPMYSSGIGGDTSLLYSGTFYGLRQ